MTRKSILFLAFAMIVLVSCNGGYQKATDGTLYIKYTNKGGPRIKAGDFVSMNVIVKTDLDSVIDNTFLKGTPRLMILPNPIFKGDVFSALRLMAEGDSLSVKMSDDSIFKKTTRPAGFKGQFVIYDIKVEKVIPKGTMTGQALQEKAMAYVRGLADVIKNAEPAKINKYIADKKMKVTKTDSGLYYRVDKKGTGPTAAVNDTAVIVYVGSLFNGKIFDTNILEKAQSAKIFNPKREYQPIGIPVQPQKAIAGWIQGLQLLNKGAIATFIIPSKLAYGNNGNGVIPPYSPLVYQIEVVSIIHSSKAKK
ncbi:FKBP-type peptidyl-prolyl cis-trans isomerase [Mucilaginibacter sp.]|uniref:FKBP-type peptidyl-prolyl cis-trans isomerase n=1 Tax=Mucilaginibacter sp. TaxID=1882438 RepID=UPI0026372800|nr:FKBP-type peptidyl-prolyl cis-trans isomerase [Mucilaginibacter sp.]MDB4927506.1 FKBP-type peptidylprolyl isomerase [Mucilaginibacter sp.]